MITVLTAHRYTHEPNGLTFEFFAEPEPGELEILLAQALAERDTPAVGITEQAAAIIGSGQPCSCDPAAIWAAALGREA